MRPNPKKEDTSNKLNEIKVGLPMRLRTRIWTGSIFLVGLLTVGLIVTAQTPVPPTPRARTQPPPAQTQPPPAQTPPPPAQATPPPAQTTPPQTPPNPNQPP